jgi:hypothetical protein
MLSVTMLSGAIFIYCYAECHYAEYLYVESNNAVSRFLFIVMLSVIIQSVIILNVVAPQEGHAQLNSILCLWL